LFSVVSKKSNYLIRGENMADIAIKRKHELGLKGAKSVADKMAIALGEKFDLKGTWSGNTFAFQRPGVNGSLSIAESEMSLEVTLGFLLKAMKGPIEKAVTENLDKALAAGKPTAKTAPKTETPAAKKTAPKKK
jgi:putative polyhydroxyalkanoate system protein